jgi:predicted phosphodiesterase
VTLRYGVLADVHANLQALETTLAFLKDARVDRLVCLGDLVGYGPQPNEVVAAIAELQIPTVAGNHDLVAAGIDPLDRCGDEARRTLSWTREEVTDETRAHLRSLPRTLELEGGILAAHGSIRDPWEYVRRVPDALRQIEEMTLTADRRLLLLGHTHRQMAIDVGSRTIATSEWILARRRRELPIAGPSFVNPGTVGQSREPRALARCAIVDLRAGRVSLHAVRYPHRTCREELRRKGLPEEWCHARPTPKKTIRQVLRDREDRGRNLDRGLRGSDVT